MSDKTTDRKGTRQKRDSTPSFVCEFPLKTNKYIDKKLGIKFRCLRDLYNMTLAECFKIPLSLIFQSCYYINVLLVFQAF